MTDLTIDGETFRVNVEGDPTHPALMLSNALGADLTMWDGQMADFLRAFRVIRYDSRGHGGSVVGDGPTSIAQLGRDALAILDALEVDKTHWVGVSMGGAVGQWLLVNAPDRIDRAVLANTAARLGTPDMWNTRITTVLADGLDAIAAATMERWFSEAFRAEEPERVAAIHAVARNTAPQGYAACCAALRDMDLRQDLQTISGPVLVISGRDDPVVPPDDTRRFVDAIKGARHVVLDALHLSNVEAEAAFNKAVVAFLTAKAAGRRPRDTPRTTTSATRRPAAARATAARNPLKKAATVSAPKGKRAAAKKPGAKAAKSIASPARRRVASKTAVRGQRKASTKRATAATVAVKPPAKVAAKASRTKVTPRRPTATTTVRGALKKAATKAKPAKVPVKKAAPKKPAAAKGLPAPRRKAASKPRRPTGRRKP